jgi:flagellar motor switch protein FliN/FliY
MPAAATCEENATARTAVNKWDQVLGLACGLSVEIPLPGFRIADLLDLVEKAVIDTHWQVGKDVPLRVNGELLAWCEFEVVENHLAVRLTELA